MEYEVGNWVEVTYTGEHCHGFKGDIMNLQIVLWNSDLWLNPTNEIITSNKGGPSRWNSFRTQDGKPVLFSYNNWGEYIIKKIDNLNYYEIY